MRNFGNCSKIPPINNETIAVAVSAGIPEIDIRLGSLLNDCTVYFFFIYGKVFDALLI